MSPNHAPDQGSAIILSYGAGVDSTAILALDIFRDAGARILGISRQDLDAALPPINAVVFADTGAEKRRTYENLVTAMRLSSGRLTVVRKLRDGRPYRIQDHHLRLGTLPVMPGCGHVCSVKFKQEAIRTWRRQTFGRRPVVQLIGYEHNEGPRCAKAGRFTPEKGVAHRFPLMELGLTRLRCEALLAALWPHPVVKSSCVFCPFMTEPELEDLYLNEPDNWALCRALEDAMRRESDRKHGAYLDALAAHAIDPEANPSPLNSRGRCKTGYWSKHSWDEGLRVFWATRIDGRALSMAEWEDHFDRARARRAA